MYGYLFKPVIGGGTYAEYVGAPASIVAKKPESVGFAYAVQPASRRGARVIATARRSNREFARAGGYGDHRSHQDKPPRRRAGGPPGGIEAIIDVVSDRDELDRIAGLVKEGGRLASSVYAADVESLAGRNIVATNVSMQPNAQRIAELSWMVEAGKSP